MRAGTLPQAPVAEHAPGPGGNGDQVKFVELACVDGRWQYQLQDQLPGRLRHAGLAEPSRLVQASCPDVVRRNKQPHAPATRNLAEMPTDGLQRDPAIAAPLPATIDRYPAEPPARGLAGLRVQDKKPSHDTGDLDGDDGMIGATTDSIEDLRNRAQEPLGLVRIELNAL